MPITRRQSQRLSSSKKPSSSYFSDSDSDFIPDHDSNNDEIDDENDNEKHEKYEKFKNKKSKSKTLTKSSKTKQSRTTTKSSQLAKLRLSPTTSSNNTPPPSLVFDEEDENDDDDYLLHDLKHSNRMRSSTTTKTPTVNRSNISNSTKRSSRSNLSQNRKNPLILISSQPSQDDFSASSPSQSSSSSPSQPSSLSSPMDKNDVISLSSDSEKSDESENDENDEKKVLMTKNRKTKNDKKRKSENDDDNDDFEMFFGERTKMTKKSTKRKNYLSDNDDDDSSESDHGIGGGGKVKKRKFVMRDYDATAAAHSTKKRENVEPRNRHLVTTSSSGSGGGGGGKRVMVVEEQQKQQAMIFEPWTEKYAPRVVDDLLMNREKQTVVESFFHAFTLKNSLDMIEKNVLIISGPPGSGKMSMVRAIVKSMGLGLKEFVHSDLEQIEFQSLSSIQFNKMYGNGGGSGSGGYGSSSAHHQPYESRLKLFDRFLQTTRYCALSGLGVNQSGDSCVHLVSELPMTHDMPRQKAELFRILRDNILPQAQRPLRRNPIVIIHNVYDSPTSLSCLYKSFPSDVLSAPNVELVKVNSFGKKNMKTVLDNIVRWESQLQHSSLSSNSGGGAYDFRTLKQTTAIKDIIKKSNGDLRHAINQLQFLSVRKVRKQQQSLEGKAIGKMLNEFSGFQFPGEATGEGSDQLSLSHVKKSRTASFNTLEDNDLRDPVIDVYHAAGRVLYGKRDTFGRLEFDLEHNVLHSVYANENSLVHYVHENLPQFCNDIDDYCKMMDDFSLGDTFCHSRLFETGTSTGSGTSFNRAKINAEYQGESLSIYNFLISCYSTLAHNRHNRAPNTKRSIYSPKMNDVFFKERDFKAKMLSTFGQESDRSIIDSASLLQETLPYRHLMIMLSLNGRDVVNGVKEPKSHTVRMDRMARIQAAQDKLPLFKTIYNFPTRGEPFAIQQQQQENLKHEETEVGNEEAEEDDTLATAADAGDDASSSSSQRKKDNNNTTTTGGTEVTNELAKQDESVFELDDIMEDSD